MGGGCEEALCKKEQLNDLEEPNCFRALGLLEKVINFLEGKGDHVIYCLNQDSLKRERGPEWLGHWGSSHCLRGLGCLLTPASQSGHLAPGQRGCPGSLSSLRMLSVCCLPRGSALPVSSVYANPGLAFSSPTAPCSSVALTGELSSTDLLTTEVLMPTAKELLGG